MACPVDATAAQAVPTAQLATDIVEVAARYENGEGVDRDYSRALGLYCRAADQGDVKAFLSIGWMYLNGRGVAIEDGIAVRWFKKAAERGVPQAANLLQMLNGVAPSARTGCSLGSGGHRSAPPPEIRATVGRVATASGVDPALVMAIIEVESGFNAQAVSPRNAQGLMQLMPETAQQFHVANTFDPLQNIRGGVAYLRWLMDRFSGNLRLVLAAYNAGENSVMAYGGVPPFRETSEYVARVTSLYRSTTN
jgi:soluble lytic murein transglycosylase-like protein